MMFESKISDKQWLILGLCSDIGWIALFAGLAVYLVNGADGLGSAAISVTFLLTALAALCVLIGIVALISQRIRQLSRVLTKRQLVLSFGFAVYGALGAGVFALASAVLDLLFAYEAGIFLTAQILMSAGGFVCFAFGLPILRSFRKKA